MREQISIGIQAPEPGRNAQAAQAVPAAPAGSRARSLRALRGMAGWLTQATARARLVPRRLRRSLIALIAAAGVCSSFVLAAVPDASAMDGRVPDSRTADPRRPGLRVTEAAANPWLSVGSASRWVPCLAEGGQFNIPAGDARLRGTRFRI
jgi:hypothetical protein